MKGCVCCGQRVILRTLNPDGICSRCVETDKTLEILQIGLDRYRAQLNKAAQGRFSRPKTFGQIISDIEAEWKNKPRRGRFNYG